MCGEIDPNRYTKELVGAGVLPYYSWWSPHWRGWWGICTLKGFFTV